MNKTYSEIVFKLRQSPFFASVHKYIRHCVSYALNFLRSPVKVSGTFILEYVFLAWIGNIIIAIMVLPVGLGARSLFLLVNIIAHSVICTR
jgi:hypothetical protein